MKDACASCGAIEGIERHHLLPRIYGGGDGQTIPLCRPCHGVVHGVKWSNRPANFGALIRAGIKAAQARGVKFGGKKGRKAGNPDIFLLRPDIGKKGCSTWSDTSKERAKKYAHILAEAEMSGAISTAEQVIWLNDRGYTTAFGRPWSEGRLRQVRSRLIKQGLWVGDLSVEIYAE